MVLSKRCCCSRMHAFKTATVMSPHLVRRLLLLLLRRKRLLLRRRVAVGRRAAAAVRRREEDARALELLLRRRRRRRRREPTMRRGLAAHQCGARRDVDAAPRLACARATAVALLLLRDHG